MCWMDKMDIHTGCVGWRRWMTHWICWMKTMDDTLDVLDGHTGCVGWRPWMDTVDVLDGGVGCLT